MHTMRLEDFDFPCLRLETKFRFCLIWVLHFCPHWHRFYLVPVFILYSLTYFPLKLSKFVFWSDSVTVYLSNTSCSCYLHHIGELVLNHKPKGLGHHTYKNFTLFLLLFILFCTCGTQIKRGIFTQILLQPPTSKEGNNSEKHAGC